MPRAGGSWINSFSQALDFLYPRKCPLCGLFSDAVPCFACHEEFVPAGVGILSGRDEGLIDFRYSLFRYEGRAAQAVRRLKYSRATSLGTRMACDIVEAVPRLSFEADLVIPVPIHWSRRCTRGFNQAELLCEHLGAAPIALKRIRKTRPQVGLSREERERNLQGAFRASPEVAGKRILLIDDVLTSGQTARECARALRAAGATEVGILAYCGET